jgi:ribosomal protein L29
MKKSAKADLRAKPAADLASEISELQGKLLKGRFAQALQGTRQGLEKRLARRQIARLKTLIGEKSRAAAAK